MEKVVSGIEKCCDLAYMVPEMLIFYEQEDGCLNSRLTTIGWKPQMQCG